MINKTTEEVMSFAVTELDQGNVIEITITGKLSQAAYDEFVPMMASLSETRSCRLFAETREIQS